MAVEADVFRDGTFVLGVQLHWHGRDIASPDLIPMRPIGNDRFRAHVVPVSLGLYSFTIEAWTDVYATWLDELRKKVLAGAGVVSEVLEGARLVAWAKQRAKGRQ